jgi:hypothetical protein
LIRLIEKTPKKASAAKMMMNALAVVISNLPDVLAPLFFAPCNIKVESGASLNDNGLMSPSVFMPYLANSLAAAYDSDDSILLSSAASIRLAVEYCYHHHCQDLHDDDDICQMTLKILSHIEQQLQSLNRIILSSSSFSRQWCSSSIEILLREMIGATARIFLKVKIDDMMKANDYFFSFHVMNH